MKFYIILGLILLIILAGCENTQESKMSEEVMPDKNTSSSEEPITKDKKMQIDVKKPEKSIYEDTLVIPSVRFGTQESWDCIQQEDNYYVTGWKNETLCIQPLNVRGFSKGNDMLHHFSIKATLTHEKGKRNILEFEHKTSLKYNILNGYSYNDYESYSDYEVQAIVNNMEPGKYDLFLEIFDLAGKKKGTYEDQIIIADGFSCNSDEDCHRRGICNEGTCVECIEDTDCSGKILTEGYFITEKPLNICYNNRCAGCGTDADCDPIIAPKCNIPMGGSVPYCTECAEQDDCQDTYWCNEYKACFCILGARCVHSDTVGEMSLYLQKNKKNLPRSEFANTLELQNINVGIMEGWRCMLNEDNTYQKGFKEYVCFKPIVKEFKWDYFLNSDMDMDIIIKNNEGDIIYYLKDAIKHPRPYFLANGLNGYFVYIPVNELDEGILHYELIIYDLIGEQKVSAKGVFTVENGLFCDSDEDCDSKHVCDTEISTCVECLTDNDCTGKEYFYPFLKTRYTLQYCQDGECAACKDNMDCTEKQPFCDHPIRGLSTICVECLTHLDCQKTSACLENGKCNCHPEGKCVNPSEFDDSSY